MEISRSKNTATYIMFPLKDANDRPNYFSGTVWASLTNEAITAYSWRDGQVPATLTVSSGTPTEMGTSGEWYLSLSATEMNPDSGNDDYILIKFNADEIDEQTVLIRLIPVEVDVTQWNGTAVATPDSAGHPKVTIKDGTAQGELNITTGRVDSDIKYVNGTQITGDGETGTEWGPV